MFLYIGQYPCSSVRRDRSGDEVLADLVREFVPHRLHRLAPIRDPSLGQVEKLLVKPEEIALCRSVRAVNGGAKNQPGGGAKVCRLGFSVDAPIHGRHGSLGGF
jgi:hypothetical protein